MDVFTAFSKVLDGDQCHRRNRRQNRSLTPIYWKVARSMLGGSASAKCGCTA